MPLTPPNLDDRTFDDIVAEALRRVPRYTPEWTDHNETDPGVTFLQLFAWMTEMTLYRLNQVPERNYLKFLQLIGVEPKPARPARVELTFELAREDLAEVWVPGRTQVAADGEDGPVLFETDETLVALGARLAAVQVFDGFAYAVETTRNEAEDQWLWPFGSGAREGAALVLGFTSTTTFTSEQVNLRVDVEEPGASASGGPAVTCTGGSTLPPPALLVWEYWDGQRWSPLGLDRDGTRAFTRSGHVYFRGPGAKIKADVLGAYQGDPLYWLRCRLARNTYDRAPRIRKVLTNTVSATQAVTVTDEVLGGSDGRPDQSFFLAETPVVERDRPLVLGPDEVGGTSTGASAAGGKGGRTVTVTSLRLEVGEGGDDDPYTVWQEVDDFYASGPDDPHFTLDRTTGEVRFGDGRHGRIPTASSANPTGNIVAREYRAGGGRGGNVGAGAVSQLQSFVQGISGVTNRSAALGGSDEESVEETRLRAPAELKARSRAVTAEDFETLALGTPGARIRRAKALPLTHPHFPCARVPGVVTVVVVPDAPGPAPTPGEPTLEAVCAHLDRHRLVTTEVWVVPPAYHEVKVEADVIARPEADLSEVRTRLEAALSGFFHPLTGGSLGTGWEFGRDLFYSEIYRVLLDVPGVDRIKEGGLYLWLDGERGELCRDVALRAGALLVSGQHDIHVTYGEEG